MGQGKELLPRAPQHRHAARFPDIALACGVSGGRTACDASSALAFFLWSPDGVCRTMVSSQFGVSKFGWGGVLNDVSRAFPS